MSRRFKVIVCRGPDCGDLRDSRSVHAAFQAVIAARGLAASVELGWHSCFGRCTQGPNVLVSELAEPRPGAPRFTFAVLPAGRPGRSALYNGCAPRDAAEIVDQHILGGTLVRRLIAPPGAPRRAAASAGGPAGDDPDRRTDGDG